MNILYRGSLSSCNYACGYCPFAKTANSREELWQDECELERFCDWVERQSARLGVLMTPWGEALIHRYYGRALVRLSHLEHVYRVSIQTNLSGGLGVLGEADRGTLALWTTYHPSQTSLEVFLRRCGMLDAMGIRYSVGVVGLREHFGEIEELRRWLSPSVYLWVNAYKRVADYYSASEVERLVAVDPYFRWNLVAHPSRGKPCWAGETSFAVDGAGNVRRCHFVPEVIGNIYEPSFADCLRPRPCSAGSCGCHIGYVHRKDFGLERVYGDGLLERIPADWPTAGI